MSLIATTTIMMTMMTMLPIAHCPCSCSKFVDKDDDDEYDEYEMTMFLSPMCIIENLLFKCISEVGCVCVCTSGRVIQSLEFEKQANGFAIFIDVVVILMFNINDM